MENKEQFIVDNIDKADWAFEKLAETNEQIEQIDDRYNKKLDRLNAWREEEIGALESNKTYFETLLTEYYIQQKAINPKFKLTSEYGAVSSRTTKAYVYSDEEVISWLEENNSDLIRVKKEINKTEFKKLYKDGINAETGEVVPGIELEEKTTYAVKLK